jgi:hypothetical protein
MDMKYRMMRRGSLTINAICETLRETSSPHIARKETRISQAESLKCKYFALLIFRSNKKTIKVCIILLSQRFSGTPPPPPTLKSRIYHTYHQKLFDSAFLHFHIRRYQSQCYISSDITTIVTLW